MMTKIRGCTTNCSFHRKLSLCHMQNVFPLLGEKIKVRGLIKKAIFNLGEELTYIIHLTLPLSLKNYKKLVTLLSGEGRSKIADCMSCILRLIEFAFQNSIIADHAFCVERHHFCILQSKWYNAICRSLPMRNRFIFYAKFRTKRARDTKA